MVYEPTSNDSQDESTMYVLTNLSDVVCHDPRLSTQFDYFKGGDLSGCLDYGKFVGRPSPNSIYSAPASTSDTAPSIKFLELAVKGPESAKPAEISDLSPLIKKLSKLDLDAIASQNQEIYSGIFLKPLALNPFGQEDLVNLHWTISCAPDINQSGEHYSGGGDLDNYPRAE